MKNKLTKILSVCLSIVILITIVPIGEMTVSAAYENTYTNTGNQRVDIVAIARTQIGNTNGSKYGSGSWCAHFVIWCAREAGVNSSIIATTGWACADDMKIPYYSRGNYTPKSGDIVFFNWPSTSAQWDHVGIVESVNSDGSVVTIEGNNNGAVRRITYSNNGYSEYSRLSSIRGYGVPNYVEPSIHKVNSSYGTNFTAYPKSKITAENIFDEYHNTTSSTAWIGTSDKCTIYEVYTDGCCKLSYPLDSGGTKTVYSKISLFNLHTHSYTGERVYELEHPHIITQRCVDYATCGGYIVTGEYAQVKSCEQCNRAETPTLQWWLSETAYGTQATNLKVGNRYYYSYRLYDSVSGKNWDEVEDCDYYISIAVYNPDGSLNYASNNNSVDESWISIYYTTPGTYTMTIKMTGDYILSKSRTFTVYDNPKKIHSSASSLNLTLGGTNTRTINVWTSGYYDGSTVLSYSRDNTNVTCSWGEWENNLLPLTITATKVGTTKITLSVKDKTTSKELHSISLTVTINCNHTYTNACDTTCNRCTTTRTTSHNYNSATCTKPQTCKVCGVTSGSALGHTYTNACDTTCNRCTATRTTSHNYNSATCTKPQTCKVCGVTSGSALGHTYTSKVTVPSCTTQGYTTHTCHCGYSYKDNYTKATDHNYSYKVFLAPTVSRNGALTGICSKCSETTILTIPKLTTTDYNYSLIMAATCTAIGSERYTWKTTSYGSFYFDVSIPAIQHKYSNGSCVHCGEDDPSYVLDENAPKIIVKRVSARKGGKSYITVSLENNPGIWGMDLAINYDKTQLTLTNVTNGTIFSTSEWTKGNLSSEKYILSYEASGFDNIKTNGVLAILEFAVNENAMFDSFASVSLSYKVGDIINANFDDINIAIVSGGINITNFVYGDLNSDGLVNKKDSLLMKMYLADNLTTIDVQAADIYVDASINKKDSLLLKQYLAGLDVELGE